MRSLTDLYEAYLRNAGGPSTSLLSLPLPVESAKGVARSMLRQFMISTTKTRVVKSLALTGVCLAGRFPYLEKRQRNAYCYAQIVTDMYISIMSQNFLLSMV